MIGRRSLVILVAKLISSALAFVGLFFITRYIGADAYGSVSWTMSLVATFFALSDLGFSSAHIKRLNEKLSVDDCISTYATIKIILTTATVMVTVVSIALWMFLLGGSVTGQTADLIVLFILYQVFYALSNIATVTYQGTMEAFKSQLVVLFDPIIRVPLVIFVAFASPGTMTLAFTYVMGGLVVAIAALVILRRDHFKWQKPTLYKSYLLFAAPLILVTIIGTVTGYLDKVIIGFFGTKADVAYYTSSQVFLSVVGILGSSVAALTYPSFSKLHTDGVIHEIRNMTIRAERYLAMYAFPIMAVIAVFPTQIAIILLGKDFAPAGESLQFLVFGTMLSVLNQVHSSQILAVNRPDISAKVTFLNFIVFIPLLFLLVPSSLFGIALPGLSYTGAAMANLTAAIVSFLAIRYVAYRLTGTGYNRRMTVQIVVALLTVGFLFLLELYLPMSNIIWLVFYAVVTLVFYFGLLMLLKEFDKEDRDYFAELLNLKEMVKYIREEIRSEEKGKE